MLFPKGLFPPLYRRLNFFTLHLGLWGNPRRIARPSPSFFNLKIGFFPTSLTGAPGRRGRSHPSPRRARPLAPRALGKDPPGGGRGWGRGQPSGQSFSENSDPFGLPLPTFPLAGCSPWNLSVISDRGVGVPVLRFQKGPDADTGAGLFRPWGPLPGEPFSRVGGVNPEKITLPRPPRRPGPPSPSTPRVPPKLDSLPRARVGPPLRGYPSLRRVTHVNAFTWPFSSGLKVLI